MASSRQVVQRLRRHPWPIVVVPMALLLLCQLGFPLIGPDEPRYAQVAREMLRRGDPVSPTLGGQLWAEKPVLLYWLMAASSVVFGPSEWALRLPSVIASLVAVGALITACVRVQGPRFALLAGAVLATSGLWWGVAHGATTDMLLSACLTVGLAELYGGVAVGRFSRPLLLRVALAFALAVLAKGLIGLVLPLLIAVAFRILVGRVAGLTRRSVALAGALFVALTSVWYVPVIARHGWAFVETFFISHHLERYLENDFSHSGPAWFYVVVVLLGSLPWTPFLLMELADIGRRLVRRGSVAPCEVFALLWAAIPVAFFSLSASKLPAYALPALPGAALLAARQLDRRLAAGDRTSLLLAGGVSATFVMVPGLALPLAIRVMPSPWQLVCLSAPVVIAVAVFAAATQRRHLQVGVASLAVGAALSLETIKSYLPFVGPMISNAGIAQKVADNLRAGEILIGFHVFEHAFTYYTDARSLYDRDGNVVILRTPDALVEAIQARGESLVVTRASTWDALLDEPRLLTRPVVGLSDDEELRFARVRIR